MSFLYKSNSYYNIVDNSFIDNCYTKIPAISKKNKIINPQNKKKINELHLKLLSAKNEKYTNHFLFSKREIEFNKSLEKNKTTFKYNKCTSFDELIKTNKNIRSTNNKMNKLKKNYSSNSKLYLTEYIYINKKKANKSLLINNTNLDSTNINSNNTNSLFNDYIRFCRGQNSQDKSFFINKQNNNKNKKVNLKLFNPKYLLKDFELDAKKEKENKKKIELEYRQLYKKNNYLNNYRKKEKEKFNYIDSFKDYLKEKINLTCLIEKKNILEEDTKIGLDLIKLKESKGKQNYKDFNEIFFVKFYEYIKILVKQIEKERIIDNNYVKYITLLKKKINSLKIEINKSKIYIEILNKFALLNAKIKQKKLELPKYYEYVFDNNIDELKQLNLSKEVIENIKEYKTKINYNEIISLINKYEYDDFNLLTAYNFLKEDINILNKQKKNLLKSFSENNYLIELINKKVIEITKLKTRNQELINNKNFLTTYVNKNMISTIQKITSKKIRKSLISINYDILYNKIIIIFNNLNEYFNHNFANINIPKAKDGIQTIIIYNLSKIEELIYLLLKKKKKLKENPVKKKLFKEMMEKNRKIRTNIELRKKRELSLKLMKKRMEERNKKVITATRANVYNYNVLSKNKKRCHKSKKVIKIETIYDYLIH